MKASDIWPIAASMWTESQQGILSSSSPDQFRCRLNTARFGLKILKTLATHGSASPAECDNVKMLVQNIMDQLPVILEQFNQAIKLNQTQPNQIPDQDREVFGKLVTSHVKILRCLAEDHYTALNHIQKTLLQYAAEIVATGRSRFESIPSRFIVNLMIIIKQFSAIARDCQINEEDGNVTQVRLKKYVTGSLRHYRYYVTCSDKAISRPS